MERRIRGRLIEIEVGEVQGVGCVAIGIVKQGLAPEIGLRFEAKAATEAEATLMLENEIETRFA